MVIMPALAECQDGANEIVPALVFRFIRRFAEQMANGIDAPSRMVNEKDTDKAGPNNSRSQSHKVTGDGPGNQAGKE